MNHSLEKLPVLFLIKMNNIFSEFMSEFSTKMAMSKSQKRKLRAMLKKRMNWNEPSFVYSKLFFIRKLCNHTSTKIEHYSTIICQHCPPNDKSTENSKTTEHPNQLTEQCSKCCNQCNCGILEWNKITQENCLYPIILDLCFRHRAESS